PATIRRRRSCGRTRGIPCPCSSRPGGRAPAASRASASGIAARASWASSRRSISCHTCSRTRAGSRGSAPERGRGTTGQGDGMAGVEQALQDALALGDEGRWDEMTAALAEALEQAPDGPYLLCWLGVAERELGNEGTAYEYFRRCIAEEPTDPHLLALAGSGLAAFDDPEAEGALRMAALSAPDLPMARLQYGAYLAREGLFDEALGHLRAAVDLAPEDPVVHAELGAALALAGDADGAAGAME